MKHKICSKCGTTNQSRFAHNTKKNFSTWCLDCTEKSRASGGRLKQNERNAQIRKGLK